MSATASILMSVFDEVEYGLVVLDKDFQARFINRAFYQMWDVACAVRWQHLQLCGHR